MRAAPSPIYREMGFSIRLISSRFVSPVYPLPNARNGGAQNGCKSSLVFKGLFLMGFFKWAFSNTRAVQAL